MKIMRYGCQKAVVLKALTWFVGGELVCVGTALSERGIGASLKLALFYSGTISSSHWGSSHW